MLAGGMSRSAICRRVQSGALTVRYPGVYSHGPGELSRDSAWTAAILACGDGAMLNLLSAAAIFDVSRWPETAPHVLVPRRHRPVDGIRIQHCIGLDPRDMTTARGIPVTTTARMFLDLGASLTPHQLCWVISEAAFRRLFSRTATLGVLTRAGRHKGIATLRRALALYIAGSAGTKSRYEDAFLAQVTPEPLVNMELLGYEVDFHWPDRRLVVEVDGNHGRPRDVRVDGARERALTAAGWTVLRFGGDEVEREALSPLAGWSVGCPTGQPAPRATHRAR